MIMKRFLFIAVLFFFCGYILHAQTDTVKKVVDSVAVKNPVVAGLDTAMAKNNSDTANYALLYVYRVKSFNGGIISYDLKLTNALFPEIVLGAVRNNTKFVVKLKQEGKTELWAKTESKKSVFLDVKFGQKYYLKCGIAMGIMVGRPSFDLVIPEQGEKEFEKVTPKP